MEPRLGDLDPGDLDAVLARFGEERTLPAASYTSAAVFDWEIEHLWEAGWLCVGRTTDFPEGSATEVRAGAESIVLANAGGTLHAFHNVCRHRGHEILAAGEARQAATLRCPYHGWAYALDGALRAAPKTGHRSDLADVRLVDVRLVDWHGWVMICVDGDARAFDEHIGSLDDLVRPYDPGSLVVGAERTYELRANWKLVHENYHECYHCSSIHPQLVEVSDPSSGHNYVPDGAWVGGTLNLRDGVETMSTDGRSYGSMIEGVPAGQALYVGLVPNLLISCHPDYVLTHRVDATAAGATTITCRWLFPAGFVESEHFDPAYAVEFWDLTNRQDWQACESLQRGAVSRGYRPGFLGEREDAVHHFLGRIASEYLGSMA